MSDTEQHNPYETPQSNLIDGLKERLNKNEYKLFKYITETKPTSDLMEYIQTNYEDILLHGKKIYMSIDATMDNVDVPKKYVKEGEIVLDVSPPSLKSFVWNEGGMEFVTCFSGRKIPLKIPLESLISIYDGKSGRGYIYRET